MEIQPATIGNLIHLDYRRILAYRLETGEADLQLKTIMNCCSMTKAGNNHLYHLIKSTIINFTMEEPAIVLTC
jgi:hypothetical protein